MGRGPRKSGFPLLWGEEGQGSGVELSPQAEAEQSGLWPDEVEGRFYFLPARLGPSPAVDGFAALWMRRVPYGENRFFFCGKRGMFLSCSCFFACPAGAKTTFSFARQKKKWFWTPKKKR